MLIDALQLQGRHYRESYILSGNQIANYWTTFAVKEKESKTAPSRPARLTPLYAGFQSNQDALRTHKPLFFHNRYKNLG